MIKIVLTDIDNTLLDFNKCAEVSLKECLEKRKIEYKKDFFEVFSDINNTLWLEIEKGIRTKEELHRDRFTLIFDKLNISLPGREIEDEFRKRIYKIAEPVDYANKILAYLHKKYDIYAVSNASHNQQLERLKNAKMDKYIKDVFTSEQFGYSKPSFNFFYECFKRIGNPLPDEVIIIGDSLTADITGGINFGLKTCWFNYKNEPLPHGITPDYTVLSLKDIQDIL